MNETILASVFVKIYRSVLDIAEQYHELHNRRIYLTPSRLKEVFPLFDKLILQKSSRIDKEIEQYLTGIRKLDEAKINIDRLEDQLVRLEPELLEKG